MCIILLLGGGTAGARSAGGPSGDASGVQRGNSGSAKAGAPKLVALPGPSSPFAIDDRDVLWPRIKYLHVSQACKLLAEWVADVGASEARVLGAGSAAAVSPEALVALRAQVFSLGDHSRRKTSIAMHESLLSSALRLSKTEHILDSEAALAALDDPGSTGGPVVGQDGPGRARRASRLPPIPGVGRLNVFALEQAMATGVYENGDPVKPVHLVTQIMGLLPHCTSCVRLRLVMLYCVAFQGLGPEALGLLSQLSIVEKVRSRSDSCVLCL